MTMTASAACPVRRLSCRFLPLGLAVIFGVLALDQLTKWMMLEHILSAEGGAMSFADWFFLSQPWADFRPDMFRSLSPLPFMNFVMVWNTGVSFGLFDSGESHMPFVLIGVAVVISVLLLGWLVTARRLWVALPVSLIVGGAIGNIIDRLRFGAVADFIDLHAGGYHWPAFNVADSCIVVGALLLMIDAWRTRHEED